MRGNLTCETNPAGSFYIHHVLRAINIAISTNLQAALIDQQISPENKQYLCKTETKINLFVTEWIGTLGQLNVLKSYRNIASTLGI